MKNYSEMSDFEINKAVALQLGSERILIPSGETCNNSVNILLNSQWVWFDPCNNPSDAWPIIVGNNISMCSYVIRNPGMVRREYWEADIFTKNPYSDKNPLRAAMIAYLMMKDAEK